MDIEELAEHAKRMKKEARIQYDSRIPFGSIQPEDLRTILANAIRNVISTDLAVFTYAQIIDGLPTADVAYDQRLHGMGGDHKIDDVHEDLCPGAMEKAREFLKDWDPAVLKFSPKVVEEYAKSTVGTKQFKLRLIELVATSIHQTGAILQRLNLRLHDGDVDSIIFWTPPGATYLQHRRTMFFHFAYFYDEVYPEGIDDVVGYWAENRILGGITLFDRSDPGEPDPEKAPNVYFHSSRPKVTYRIYQLLDEQQESLIGFLLATSDSPASEACPLPIQADKTNRVRVDWQVATATKRIFRDEWERKPITHEELRTLIRRPRSEIDYPGIPAEISRINSLPATLIPKRILSQLADSESDEDSEKQKMKAKKIKSPD